MLFCKFDISVKGKEDIELSTLSASGDVKLSMQELGDSAGDSADLFSYCSVAGDTSWPGGQGSPLKLGVVVLPKGFKVALLTVIGAFVYTSLENKFLRDGCLDVVCPFFSLDFSLLLVEHTLVACKVAGCKDNL